jgi:hypothetical protein
MKQCFQERTPLRSDLQTPLTVAVPELGVLENSIPWNHGEIMNHRLTVEALPSFTAEDRQFYTVCPSSLQDSCQSVSMAAPAIVLLNYTVTAGQLWRTPQFPIHAINSSFSMLDTSPKYIIKK